MGYPLTWFLKRQSIKSGYATLFLITLLVLSACKDGSNSGSEGSDDQLSSITDEQTKNSEDPGNQLQMTPENNGADSENDGSLETDGSSAEVTALPLTTIVICMGSQPASLFPYGDISPTLTALQDAFYEPLITSTGYQYQAHGLEKLPSLADGDAAILDVMVEEGERVVDHLGNIVTLKDEVVVIDSGGMEIIFNGTPIQMKQMLVDFTFKPLVWSDGTAVTAQDSVRGFEMASESESAYRNPAVAHTTDYQATGDLKVRWVGLPGYLDQTYFTNVWLPLPEHQDKAIIKESLLDERANGSQRLSSGPFVVNEVREDGSLVLIANEYYYRADEGLPKIGEIIVRFGNAEDFLAGDQAEPCDVITPDALSTGNLPLLETAAAADNWQIQTVPGPGFEYLAFGINPVTEYADRRPDWFEDARVRQALTMCTDRERMVEELTGGKGQVIHAYVADDHPLYPADAQEWPYDPVQANSLLDEVGYVDFAGDGRRQDLVSGVPMTVTLGTNSESVIRLGVLDIVKENLAECGIPVETYDLSAGTWYAAGPQGRLFGRSFDLASLAWLSQILPDCGLFLEENITGPEEFGFGGWQNINITGWSQEAFNGACRGALTAMPGGTGYEDYQEEALRLFTEELPAMPLFTSAKIAAVRDDVKQAQLDPSQDSMLWNIFEWEVDR